MEHEGPVKGTIPVIKFLPSGREAGGEPGGSILDAARKGGVFIESPCGGQGKCGKCRIRVSEGSFNSVSEEEVALVGADESASGVRLACRARALTDATVLVTDEYILPKESSAKTFSGRVGVAAPAVKAYRVPVPHKGGGKGSPSDGAALVLAECHGLEGVTVTDQDVYRSWEGLQGHPEATVFVWMGREIIKVAPANDGVMLGAAVDIGTTTVAVYLCDLATGHVVGSGSFANPQIVFGADVISRIAYSVRHGEDGLQRMREGLILSINSMVRELTESAGYSPSHVLDMTVVGNTVMHHIFLNVSPDRLGLSPFQPAITAPVDLRARELGIRINPSSYVHILPVEAGFVGADNVAVILSEMPHAKAEPTLIIDIGTNGEIVLGSSEKTLSCSCATGPALEGAGISQGSRAVKGAVERVRIDRSSLEVECRIVGLDGWSGEYAAGELSPTGICGSGIIDAVAELHGAGIIGDDGSFRENPCTARLQTDGSGSRKFVLIWREQTSNGMEIAITQRDIRQFQLAKGALRAGCEVLMKRYGVDSVKKIVIAGAFGMHIDITSALATGLFPPCDPEDIHGAGNAAGHGAYLALMDTEKRAEADLIARRTSYVELASDKDFQSTFLKALFIPYKT